MILMFQDVVFSSVYICHALLSVVSPRDCHKRPFKILFSVKRAMNVTIYLNAKDEKM